MYRKIYKPILSEYFMKYNIGAKKNRICISLPEKDIEFLRGFSSFKDISMSKLISQMITQYTE